MVPLMLADLLIMACEGAPPKVAVGAWSPRVVGVEGIRAERSGAVGIEWLTVGSTGCGTLGREAAERVCAGCAGCGCACACKSAIKRS